MVYRVPQTGSRTAAKVFFINFITKWCFYALICYAVFGTRGVTPAARYTEWIMLGMALPAALVAALQFRRIRQNTATYGEHFYTLTKGGVLIENGNGRTSTFIPWSEVAEARLVLGHTIFLRLTNGKSLHCLLEGLPEERIAEFAAYATAHAGTTPSPAELTPPPAEPAATTPLLFSATKEQGRELADTQALLSSPPRVWTRLYPLLLVLWGVCFLYSAARAEYLILIIIAFIIRNYAARLWHPGGPGALQNHIRPTHIHFADNQLLLTIPSSNSWHLNRQSTPLTNYPLPHGTCVQYADGFVMLDPDQPMPAGMQAPGRQIPRPLPHAAIATLLGIIFIGALYCFTLSNTWRLHRVLSQESPDIPTALSLVRMPASTQVSDITAYYTDEKANILLHKKGSDFRCAAILYLELANGKCVCAGFDQYGRLVFREIQDNDE